MQQGNVSADQLLDLINQFSENLDSKRSFRLRVALEIAAIELAKMQSSNDDEATHQSDRPSE